MADFNNKAEKHNDLKHGFGDSGSGSGFASSPDAAESGGRKKNHIKMNRIDKPTTTSISGNALGGEVSDSTSDDFSIEKQMEAESGNAIQYRTCSWQKVRSTCGVASQLCHSFDVAARVQEQG